MQKTARGLFLTGSSHLSLPGAPITENAKGRRREPLILSHHFLPSTLHLPKCQKALQLRFRSDQYELTLFEGRSAAFPTVRFTQGQIKHVTIEMLSVERGPLKLSFEDRHIVIRADGKVWAKVPDVTFMRLHAMAAIGAGESVDI